jgi:MSHA biogenesis protein MshQ
MSFIAHFKNTMASCFAGWRWRLHVFLCCLALAGINVNTAYAINTGFQDPSTCTSVNRGGPGWNNTTRAQSNNGSYATVSVDGTTSDYLECYGYGFNIPTGATINGITVRIQRFSSSTGNGGSRDAYVYLMQNGTISTAVNRALATSYDNSATAASTVDYGSGSDLWGTSWTVANINSGNFGVAFAATKPSAIGGAQTISVDYIDVAVDYTPDTTPPTVTSINRVSSSPTAASSVQWTVTFSESVTGVSAADFFLANTGLTGTPAITSVTGSGTTYTVTASTGDASADGTLGLNLVDDDSITDAVGNRLGGSGTGNGNFTGQTYSIKKPPSVTSIVLDDINPTSAASVQWDVTFSEDVSGVSASNFALVKTGLSGTPSITSVTGSGTVWTVTALTTGGTGTLQLNMTNSTGVTDGGGSALSNVPYSGPAYTISPTAPSECFIDSFVRANGAPGSDWSVGHESGTFGDPRIVSNRFRLTDASTQASTYATLQRIFPGAGNKIIVEFTDYAYGGNGADGIAMVLSDASIPPVAGAFGGSLGYAPKQTSAGGDTTHAGFAGGWIGVALDEYGNFSNPTEGRSGGPGQRADSVAIRGSGSGFTGYTYLTGTAAGQTIDTTSTSPGPGYRYRITVDHSDSLHAYTKVERDTTGTGNSYTTMIGANNSFDAKAASGQAAVPTNWSLSFTGSTGGSSNIHEIGNLQVCSISLDRLDHIQLEYASGSCGAAVPVTVKACANANCSRLYVGKVTVALSSTSSTGTSSWSSGNSLVFYNGQAQTTLSHTPTENAAVNIGATASISPPTSQSAPTCVVDGVTNSCIVNFSAACSFDAVEGTTPNTPIYTKLAGTQFILNLIPLGSSGAAVPYTGDVTASLVSSTATSGNCTDTNTGLLPEATVSFAGQSSRPVSFTYSQAKRDVRVRVISNGVPSCSSDNFAIRPVQFTLSHTLGASPVAGNDFTLTANAGVASGYDGTPAVNASALTTTPTFTAAPPLIGAFGAADGQKASGTFRYEDAGVLVFPQTVSVVDSGFTGVDQANGFRDCVKDSTTIVKDSSGRYGCLIGNLPMTIDHFRPDHYEVTLKLVPACNGFTYMGQAFNSQTGIALKAMSSNGTQLNRYGAGYPSLSTFAITADNGGAVPVGSDGQPIALEQRFRNGSGDAVLPQFAWSQGGYTGLTSGANLTRAATGPDGPFNNFKLQLSITDSENVKITSFNNAPITGTNSVSSDASAIRFGRLTLGNANGSELLNLTVPVSAQYWNGAGFVSNTLDSCTSFVLDDVVLNNAKNLTPGAVTASSTPVTLNSGAAKLVIGKPTSITGKGSVDICVDLDTGIASQNDTLCKSTLHQAGLPWLQGRWSGSSTGYKDDPKARATFGVFKSGPVIYLREVY